MASIVHVPADQEGRLWQTAGCGGNASRVGITSSADTGQRAQKPALLLLLL